MSVATALILYPSWAIAVLFAATATRLGRSTPRGLVVLCLLLAMWVTALVLVELPGAIAIAERVVPFGMLQAGAYVHAGTNVIGGRSRVGWIGYGWGAVVGVTGAIWPRGFYGPGVHGAGPILWPIAIVSAVGAALVVGWMFREIGRRTGIARRQMTLLAVGNLLGISAGGGAILLRATGALEDLRYTAPALLGAVVLVGAAVVRGETGPARRIVGQALVRAVLAAAVLAVGVTALIALVPALAPSASLGWTLFVAGCALVPLDALRALIVDALGRRLFRASIGVRDLADAAERAEVRADQAGRLAELGALVSAVAHEVRNPLGVIAAHAKLLERAGAPEGSVAALRAQVDRASRFVDDLLHYGKPRPLEIREVAVRAAVDEAVRMVRATHPGAPIELAIDDGLRIEADRGALVDAVVILASNAAIAVAGTGRVTIAADAAQLAVSDTGPGVPAAIEARLFQPFVTGRGRDHAHPGTGLGLAIARSIAERHGGTLHHERPAEGGARFVLRWSGAGPR
jgi:signal transduction histidine kinase